jgi:hypothetical protein
MAVAAPNQTRLKILASVLRLESFTVAELCLHAGLERSMVYRELSELQQQGMLTSNSAIGEGEAGPRHRPPKRYELSSDAKMRERLEAELGSFLPNFEDAKSNRHLKKAQEVLNLLGVELLGTGVETLDDTKLNIWEERWKGRFEEAQKELRRATWESETDFSEAGASDHPIMLASRLYEGLELRVTEQLRAERSRRESEAARKKWGNIFTSALRAAIPKAAAASSPTFYSVYVDDFVDFGKISTKLSRKIKEEIESSRDLRSRRFNVFLPYVSSYELDVRGAESESEFVAILAKHGIAYGSSAEEPLALVRGLVAKSKDYRLFFDEANLAQLAEQPEEAYNSWSEYLSKKPSPEAEDIEKPVVARISAERWSADAYRRAVEAITKQCKASVAVLSETPFEQNEGYAIELKLYNPVRDRSEEQAALISIGDPLLQNKRLYLATTEADLPVVLGLPSFACAAWFRSRVGQRKAWDLAGTVKPTERVVKVEFFRGATAAARAEAERVLTDSLSAELVG